MGKNPKIISVIPYYILPTPHPPTALRNKIKTTGTAKSFDIAKTPDF